MFPIRGHPIALNRRDGAHRLFQTLGGLDTQIVMNGLPIGSVPPNEENDDGIVREIEAGFNVGRPPQLPPGAEQTVPFAININSVSFDSPGRYQFVVSIDGSDVATLPFTVVGQFTMGPVVR